MISARDPHRLPDIPTFRRLTRSLAMLDAILFPDWEYRYHSFDAHWGTGEQMASMRNGQGDHWFALFAEAGVVIIGLDHEASMYRPDDPWPGLFDGIPHDLSTAIGEPAFDSRNSTFCIWRHAGAMTWERGPIRFPLGDAPDGSAQLLSHLDGDVESYRAFARERYGIDPDREAVAHVYGHGPLTDGVVARLNPAMSVAALDDAITEIGYPESPLRV